MCIFNFTQPYNIDYLNFLFFFMIYYTFILSSLKKLVHIHIFYKRDEIHSHATCNNESLQ